MLIRRVYLVRVRDRVRVRVIVRESSSEGLTLRGAKKPVGAIETTGARPAEMVTVTWSGLGIGLVVGYG